jgi:hypothetical protein
MGNQTDADDLPIDKTGESTLRGAALAGSEQKKSVAHAAFEKTRNPDATLHLDGEEDTLYDDGLELEDDSAPLTGKDGRDDSQS